MEIRREDCLFVDGKVYFEDDIIIVRYGNYGKKHELKGRIERIDTLYIVIDCSEQYRVDKREFKYKDIDSIEKCEEE